MNSTVRKNYDYFVSNRSELYEKYPNKQIVLKDCNVIGAYDSFDEAMKNTLKTEQIGTFSIQHCTKEDEPIVFYSPNIWFEEDK